MSVKPAFKSRYELLQTFQNPALGLDDLFGLSVAAVGNNVLVGAPFDGRGLLRSGAAYLFDGDPVSPSFGKMLMRFKNPRPGLYPKFGFSVAAIRNNVLIGAFLDGTLAPNSGAAHLFDGDPVSPTFGKLLMTYENPSPGPGDFFGVAVAAVGGNRALIGAFRDGTAGYHAGAAYLFDADPASPTFGKLLLTFLNPYPNPYDEFGHSVAAIGDNVLIGAFRDDTVGFNAGAAYLFDGTTGDLLKTFLNPRPTPHANFGFSIKDVSRNILVGAWWDHTRGAYAGAAYLFDGDPASRTFGRLLMSFENPSPSLRNLFGVCLGTVGRNILIGATGGGRGKSFSGGVYLFHERS